MDNSVQLAEMAMDCTKIKIYEGDGLPDKICAECIAKLSSAYIFKQQCERSDQELRRNYVPPPGAPLTDNYISELLNNGDVSEIEDFDIDEDDFDLEPNILFALAAEEDCSSEEQDDKQDVIEDESSSIPESVVEPPEAPIIPPSIPSGRTTRTSRQGRKISHCTNLYYLRSTGRELKCTSTEITKLLAIHIIMGCVPYPRLPMYWRAGTKLGLICNIMSRDRFLTLRNALHVVEGDSAPDSEKGNVLWKVQPMIDKVKDTCNKLERVPDFTPSTSK
ncbi:hypothetical protein EVAR_63582_1 [Eumeta japonica]|uniref:ZAD domain-containing protein n=1 Tax=Eumeta variegata TaxID=151549 RepID=A0A4C1ZSE5_EUMVA|nr:hypothetical protein EVAR_63582_1 [Eumeta japonica]